MKQVANSWRATGDHSDTFGSTANEIENMAGIAYLGGPGGWNYADFLMTGGAGCNSYAPGDRCPGQTEIEYRSEFSLWSITASPLIVATDVRNMTTALREILLNTEIIAVNQENATPPGDRLGYWPCAEGPLVCQIWGRAMSDGSYAAVVRQIAGLARFNALL